MGSFLGAHVLMQLGEKVRGKEGGNMRVYV
jgi:hypothetical protein